jgi:hypothetical protein
MKKSIIFNPFTPIPKSEKSHIRGWAMMWAQRLDADIATKETDLLDYENIYIDHGVNFHGSLNLFGGFNDDIVSNCYNLMHAVDNEAKLFSLDWKIKDCNYISQIEKRIGAKTTSEMVDFNFLERFENILNKAKYLPMESLNLDKWIIGDSHTLAFSTKDQVITRLNGQTLYNAIYKKGLDSFLHYQNKPKKIKEITLCLGSIDIRFHLLRLKTFTAKEFADLYAKEIIKWQNFYNIPIKVCAPVPIEHELRKLPKTGQFEGQNFYGARWERLKFTFDFIKYLSDYCFDFDLIQPPKEWYTMPGDEYAREIMELHSSVHIAPKYYRSIYNWN